MKEIRFNFFLACLLPLSPCFHPSSHLPIPSSIYWAFTMFQIQNVALHKVNPAVSVWRRKLSGSSEGWNARWGGTFPLPAQGPPAPSLCPGALLPHTPGPDQKHLSECWAKKKRCGLWTLSTVSGSRASSPRRLCYRQSKFRQRPRGSLSRAGLLGLGTSMDAWQHASSWEQQLLLCSFAKTLFSSSKRKRL